MQEKTLTVRIEPELRKKIEILGREKIETKSNIVREALMNYIQKEMEMKEIKKVVAEKFTLDKISFEELIRIVGYKEAKKIAFYVATAKKSFEEGLR